MKIVIASWKMLPYFSYIYPRIFYNFCLQCETQRLESILFGIMDTCGFGQWCLSGFKHRYKHNSPNLFA